MEAAVNAKQFLEDESTRHTALKPGLAAIKDTNSFSIDRNKRNELRVSDAYYALFYQGRVADILTASEETVRADIDTMFDGETAIVPSTVFGGGIQNCDGAFGSNHYGNKTSMSELHEYCQATASNVLKERLDTKLALLKSDDITAEDLKSGGKFALDNPTKTAAIKLGLIDLANAYEAALRDTQTGFVTRQVAKIDAAVARVTEGDTSEFEALCENADGNRATAQACDRGTEALNAIRLQAQCNAKLASSSLDEEYLDDVIAYTSPRTGDKAEVPVRDLVCLMTRGDEFNFQTSGFSIWTTTQFTLGPKGDPDALVGDLALISEDGTKAVWEVETLDSTPKGFEDIEPAIIIGCIAEKVRC